MNPRRKYRVTVTLDLPAEWTASNIRSIVHYQGIRPVTADELSSVTIEEVPPLLPDPKQEKLDL